MPIYEYTCTACGEDFEAIQKFSDKPLTRCLCGKSGKVERKLSLSAFQLKGGGWYKDQYGSSGSNGKSNGDGKAAKSDAKSAKESGGSDSVKPGASSSDGGKSSGSKSAGDKSSGSKSGGASAPA